MSDPGLIERRFRALFENTNDAVFIIDMYGRHLEVNQRASEMFGYTIDELLNLSTRDLVVQDEANHSRNVLEHMINGGYMPIYERRFRHKDGTIIMTEINVALIRDQNGSPLYVQSIVRDITQRKQMEQARLESERLRLELEKERELNNIKTELMVTIAHEFRTPLSLILLQRDVLDRYFHQLTDIQRRDRLVLIRKQVYRLTGMLDDMSFLVKGTINALEVRPAAEDLEDYLARFVQDFRSLIGSTRSIHLSFEGDLKHICLDSALLRRILTNLLLNAVKYSSEPSEIQIEAARVGREIRFVVCDHGIGIPLDEQPHIFELFFRGSNARGERGTGLGLSIVAQALELCGGKIQVHSEIGVGSIFTVMLPILDVCGKLEEDHLGRG